MGGVASRQNPATLLELNELLPQGDDFCFNQRGIRHEGTSSPCFCHFQFDGGGQSVNSFEGFLIEVGLD
jgi:hypothetical protein